MANVKTLPSTYDQFWPYYLQEHSSPNTRRLHYLGSSLSLCLFVTAAVLGRPSLLLVGLLAGMLAMSYADLILSEKSLPADMQADLAPLIMKGMGLHGWDTTLWNATGLQHSNFLSGASYQTSGCGPVGCQAPLPRSLQKLQFESLRRDDGQRIGHHIANEPF